MKNTKRFNEDLFPSINDVEPVLKEITEHDDMVLEDDFQKGWLASQKTVIK
jgi:hypothetical protein